MIIFFVLDYRVNEHSNSCTRKKNVQGVLRSSLNAELFQRLYSNTSFQAPLLSKVLNLMAYCEQSYRPAALELVQNSPIWMQHSTSLCVHLSGCFSAVHRPVDKVEEYVRTRENHPGVFVNCMRVLDDVEGTQALLFLGGSGLTAH